MHGVGHLLQVIVGQDHASRGFNMRSEHHGWLERSDLGPHFSDGCRCPRLLNAAANRPCLENGCMRRDLAHIDDLGPAVGEPAVTNDENRFVARKLTSHGFHAESSAAGYERDAVCVVNRFEHAGNIAHDTAKLLTHVVERAVGVDHRKFEQSAGVDVGK